MFDCENVELDYNKLLTITNTVQITGSKGTEFSFLKWRQYMMCGCMNNVSVVCSTCPDVEHNTYTDNFVRGMESFWVVCIDGEKFLIPKQDGCIEGYLRQETQQNFTIWKERYWTGLQPRNYKEAAFYILGRIINTGNPDIANQREYDRIKGAERKSDGRNFGTTAKEPEDDAF
jgi:hypothetical protein